MSEWYDTREGLQVAVRNGIPGLTELAKERRKAGYDRKERMSEWMLLGLYYLDTCGNFSLITENAPHERRRFIEVKDVMTHEEVKALNIGFWTSTPCASLPPINRSCDRCGNGWSIHNIDDFHQRRREESPYRHESCHKLAAIEEEQEFFRRVLERSEVPYEGMRAIPNQYHSGAYDNPWFIVTTKWGEITIGWRKRVICIDWAGSQINHNGDITFKEEGVTTGRTLVHAWGEDKAVEYLRRLGQGNFNPAD